LSCRAPAGIAATETPNGSADQATVANGLNESGVAATKPVVGANQARPHANATARKRGARPRTSI
jgi:hypothetical protein